MKAVVIEDSALARIDFNELLKKHPNVEIVGEAGDVDSAVSLINKLQPDLVFLDIDMPGGNGFDVLEALDSLPTVIFTTAYDEYAIKSFEYNALDYLLKPIHPKRLAKAIDRLPKAKPKEQKTLTGQDRIFVKNDNRCWLLPINEINLIEANGSQCQLYFGGQSAFVSRTLNSIEQRFDSNTFVKISRQKIINMDSIRDIQLEDSGGFLIKLTSGQLVSSSRRAALQIKQLLSL